MFCGAGGQMRARNAVAGRALIDPVSASEEITDILLHGESVRIERIASHGQASVEGFWYDQNEHEWVLLLQGRAGLEIEGEGVRTMNRGDYLLLPAHRRHRVAWTDQDTVWLAVFFTQR